MDYVEKKAEVCVPTFKTDCEAEDVKNGLVIKQQEECYQVRWCTLRKGEGQSLFQPLSCIMYHVFTAFMYRGEFQCMTYIHTVEVFPFSS